jgi:hypothetical protein
MLTEVDGVFQQLELFARQVDARSIIAFCFDIFSFSIYDHTQILHSAEKVQIKTSGGDMLWTTETFPMYLWAQQ